MAILKKLYGEYALIILVILIGIFASGVLAAQYQKDLQAGTIENFRSAAQDRIRLISDKIEHNKIVMRLLAAFFRASDSVSREDFKTYTNQIIKDYSYIHTLEWIPSITNAERSNFEQSLNTSDFQITELNNAGDLVKANIRPNYFPIQYAEPLINGNNQIIGFDVASDPERLSAIERAMEARQPAATSKVNLLQAKQGDEIGIVFYEPVVLTAQFGPEGQGKLYDRVSGFIGSVVPLAAMIDAALEPLSFQGVNIVIHDLTAQLDENKLLYTRSTRLKKIPDSEILADYQSVTSLREKGLMNVGGRQWEVTIIPARGYFTLNMAKETYFIFFAGSFMTLLLAFYMFSRANENQRIYQEVNDRTEQLSKAKRQIEMILLSTHEGIIGLDENNNISFCNVTASQLLGYRKSELVGQNHHTLFHGKHIDGKDYNEEDCPIQKILDYGQPCNVRDEVFWNKNGESVQIDYAGSPIIEGGEVKGAVVVFRDVREQRELEKKLENMARYDQLTGIANRNMFIEYFKTALSRAERLNKKVGLIYMDLNGFKPINDTLGHSAGDLLLKKFAQMLKEICRDTDLPARLGGDEFVILVDSLDDEKQCLILVDRLKKRLEKPFEIEGKNFNIGASVGISYFPEHSKNYEELITFADEAMYKAKSNKALPYVIYNP